jgi:hypothetical protein
MLTTSTLGIVALVVALLGVLSRLLVRARPLHTLIPAPYRWIPDAVAAAAGALLIGLPVATDWIQLVETVATAILLGALAVAPGASTPEV